VNDLLVFIKVENLKTLVAYDDRSFFI
jgi:hypothetical protein